MLHLYIYTTSPVSTSVRGHVKKAQGTFHNHQESQMPVLDHLANALYFVLTLLVPTSKCVYLAAFEWNVSTVLNDQQQLLKLFLSDKQTQYTNICMPKFQDAMFWATALSML